MNKGIYISIEQRITWTEYWFIYGQWLGGQTSALHDKFCPCHFQQTFSGDR